MVCFLATFGKRLTTFDAIQGSDLLPGAGKQRRVVGFGTFLGAKKFRRSIPGTLKLTASLPPENQWLEDDSCPFGALKGLFSGGMFVSGRVFLGFIASLWENFFKKGIIGKFGSGIYWKKLQKDSPKWWFFMVMNTMVESVQKAAKKMLRRIQLFRLSMIFVVWFHQNFQLLNVFHQNEVGQQNPHGQIIFQV